ncbi:solute carrier family 22 member 7-like isoform X2 [Paramormyrops kingsleyae]|uniref:solute carrier family 22 member 7-like isoform X2 n=1 Tax=Paramormyrops kingsleyae TaxID=1676925 RepID=UPI000CD5CCEA|nr:solute carrier family 22 member 7-like isoform X2 [Paramormyrops kingsleyae]
MKFENLLAEAGGFGRFQVIVLSIVFVSRFTLPCHFLVQNFIAAVPPHHCDINFLDDGEFFENFTQEQRMIVSIPAEEDGSLSSCQMFSQPQFHLLHEVTNATAEPAVPCQNGWVYDTSTFASTIATEWDLICDQRKLNKVTATIFFIGVMIGAVLFGSLSDRYGRKRMMLLSYVLGMAFGLASAFSSSFVMFAILRFFTGLGITGISIISTVLSVEWVSIEHRRVVGVLDSLAWTFGSIMLACIAYLVNDWRWLIVAITSPLAVAIVSWRWLPESARWLIATGRVQNAHYYLTRCAKMNASDGFASKIKPEDLSTVVVVEKGKKTYSYLDLVRTPKMRRLALKTGLVCESVLYRFGIASTFYGISLNLAGFGLNIYLTQFIYALVEVPTKLLVYYLLERIGRRYTEAGALLLAGICLAVNVFIPKDKWIFRSIIAVLGKAGSSASFTTIFLYTSELYPTVVRQNGLGYNSFLARLGVSIAPLIMLLDEVWKPLPQIILCVIAIASGLTARCLPETMNRRLPETIEDIEQTSFLTSQREAYWLPGA